MEADIRRQDIHDDRDVWVHRKTTAGMQMPTHWHTHFEILLVYEGDCRIAAGGREYNLREPFVVLYRPFTPHGMTVSGTYTRSMVNFGARQRALFSERLFSLSFLDHAPLFLVRIPPSRLPELEKLFSSLFANRDDFACSQLYLALIVNWLRLEEGDADVFTEAEPYVEMALRYMGENLSQPLALEEVARHFGVGRTKLNRDLREAVGMTFRPYLTELRLTRAREMLLDGFSVTRTAFECGYSGESHFICAFHRRWGVTPGAMKKQGYCTG